MSSPSAECNPSPPDRPAAARAPRALRAADAGALRRGPRGDAAPRRRRQPAPLALPRLLARRRAEISRPHAARPGWFHTQMNAAEVPEVLAGATQGPPPCAWLDAPGRQQRGRLRQTDHCNSAVPQAARPPATRCSTSAGPATAASRVLVLLRQALERLDPTSWSSIPATTSSWRAASPPSWPTPGAVLVARHRRPGAAAPDGEPPHVPVRDVAKPREAARRPDGVAPRAGDFDD